MESMFRVFDFRKGPPQYFGYFMVKITKNLFETCAKSANTKGLFPTKGPLSILGYNFIFSYYF
jgi:hypothetical protein